MTEAEAREIVVTPEMLEVGYRAYIDEGFIEPGHIEQNDGLTAAFQAMLRVWLAQGAPGATSLRHS